MISNIIQYKLADTCELECNPCKLWQKNTEEEFPSLADITLDLQALKKRGVKYINFTGGDPLLHPDVVEILSRAKKAGFKTIVTTHGGNYTSFKTGLKGYADLMIFLLHSYDAVAHDAIAGAESFSRVMDAIAYAKESRQRVMISYNVTRDNVQEIPEMYELAEAKSVLLWLNPLPTAYGVSGFTPDSIAYIRYYSTRKYAWLNLADLWFLANNTKEMKDRQDCIARDEIVTQAYGKLGIPFFLNMYSMLSLRWKLARIPG